MMLIVKIHKLWEFAFLTSAYCVCSRCSCFVILIFKHKFYKSLAILENSPTWLTNRVVCRYQPKRIVQMSIAKLESDYPYTEKNKQKIKKMRLH